MAEGKTQPQVHKQQSQYRKFRPGIPQALESLLRSGRHDWRLRWFKLPARLIYRNVTSRQTLHFHKRYPVVGQLRRTDTDTGNGHVTESHDTTAQDTAHHMDTMQVLVYSSIVR